MQASCTGGRTPGEEGGQQGFSLSASSSRSGEGLLGIFRPPTLKVQPEEEPRSWNEGRGARGSPPGPVCRASPRKLPWFSAHTPGKQTPRF